MKRRWKVGIAMAVVGLAGFLVWAFRSSATPPLSIGFYGYVTNDVAGHLTGFPPPDGSVLAVFAVTNHSGRTMEMFLTGRPRITVLSTNIFVNLIYHQKVVPELGGPFTLFSPGEGTLAWIRVGESDGPIRVILGSLHPFAENTAWSRFWNRMPWNQRNFSATATSKPR